MPQTTAPRVALVCALAIAAGLFYVHSRWIYVHFSNDGYLLDSGWLAYLFQSGDPLLRNPISVNGLSFYAHHLSPHIFLFGAPLAKLGLSGITVEAGVRLSPYGAWLMDVPRRSYFACVAVVIVALLSVEMRAQSLTGSLLGTVKDTQGGVLQGAIIRVTSPALIGGEQRTISNQRGEWRFPSLPPGGYALSVELTPQFAPCRKNQLGVGADETLEVAIVLQLADIAESVTVTGDVAISSRNSGLETRSAPTTSARSPLDGSVCSI
jgi:Carboxypeptidase regulatory-like domain